MLDDSLRAVCVDQDGDRRLLVVTYHFPPDEAVGGLRWAGLSKYLARRGWEVHVVTAAMGEDAEVEPGVVVHRFPRRRTLNDLYRETVVQRRNERIPPALPAGEQPPTSDHPPLLMSQALTWFRRTVGTTLSFPDDGRGWVLKAAFKTRQLLRGQRFCAVVSSGPPHSAHLAAMMALAGSGIPYWIDMRDPWYEPSFMSAADQFDATHHIIRGLEIGAVRAATGLVVNTPEFGRRMHEKYPDARVSVVTNGIDRERLPPPARTKFDGLSIAYAGTLYFNRDLTPIVRGLRQFLDQHPDARGGVKLRVAGKLDPEHVARFWSEVDAADLRDAVEVYGLLPRADALDLLNRSHLAVVLAQHQGFMIPAKLYECVAMRLATLVVAEDMSAAAQEARRIGGIACDPSDVDRIRAALESLWYDRNALQPGAAKIGYDSIADQVEALLLAPSNIRA